ncbi:MAG: helix-turn-helix domain-containing protein [Anaerolineae bacterium]|nr:helix-turn-helix domain-containing protein [Anaerolineae bacterium]
MTLKNKNGIEFVEGSGNVFADLGLPNADELYLRASLGTEIVKIIRKKGYSQKEVAKILGIKQPEVSALLNAKFQRFSQEKLISFLNKLDYKITIQVSPHNPGEPYQEFATT